MKHDISISQVARVAKVSIATVSNVVNGKGRVSSATMKRVQKAIDELGYVPNLLARHLKTSQSRLIGLLVPTAKPGRIRDNPFYWDLLAGIEAEARDRSFHIILTGVEEEEEALAFVRERQLDGLLVAGAYQNLGAVDKIRRMDIPCVFIDSNLKDPHLYQVCLNDRLGGYLATKHLLELGHRRIALFIGDISMENIHQYGVLQERWLGYRMALHEAGLLYDPGLIICLPTSAQGGYMAVEWLTGANNVSAVFSLSDIAALGLMKGLRDKGWSVPKQILLVGFDDICLSGYALPGLTTVSQNIYMKGQAAMKLLMDQIESKSSFSRKVVLPVQLKIRETTARSALM
jgi:LacI family transcriptional regulator